MRRQLPVIASILLIVAVIALIYLRDSRNVPEPAPAAQIRVFPQITNTDFRSVRLMDPSEPQDALVLAWNASTQTWVVPGTNTPPLDQQQVDVLLTVLARMTFTDSVAPGEGGFASYGLGNDGRFVIEFTTLNGIQHRIKAGNLSDSGTAYFVRIDELDRVSIVDRERIDYLIATMTQPPLQAA